MQDRLLEIVFMESGIEIARWKFDTTTRESGREYHEKIEASGIEVELKVKYVDRGEEIRREVEVADRQWKEAGIRRENAENALRKLVDF